MASNKFELAIKDFQYILEKSPEDKDINQSLRDAREKLEVLQEKEQDKKDAEVKAKKFKRVAIEESDSEEEEAAKPANADGAPQMNSSKKGGASSPEESISPSKSENAQTSASSSEPTIEEVGTSEKSNWWQKKEKNYDEFDSNKGASEEASPTSDLAKQLADLQAQQAKLEAEAYEKRQQVEKAVADQHKAENDLKEAELKQKKMGQTLDDSVMRLDNEMELSGKTFEDIDKEF